MTDSAIAAAIADFDVECPRFIAQHLQKMTKEHMKYCAFPHRAIREVAKVARAEGLRAVHKEATTAMHHRKGSKDHMCGESDVICLIDRHIAALPLEGVEE